MFLLGFITGFVFLGCNIVVAYIIIKEIIKKYGNTIKNEVNNEIGRIKQNTSSNLEIIYPNDVREMFEKEGSELEDIIKN